MEFNEAFASFTIPFRKIKITNLTKKPTMFLKELLFTLLNQTPVPLSLNMRNGKHFAL